MAARGNLVAIGRGCRIRGYPNRIQSTPEYYLEEYANTTPIVRTLQHSPQRPEMKLVLPIRDYSTYPIAASS